MQYYLVCPIGVISGAEDLLTYHSDTNLSVGEVVLVPFGRRTKIAVVFDKTTKPAFTTRPIEKSYGVILPQHLIKLAEWIADYYASRLPFVLQMMLPSGIQKKRRAKEHPPSALTRGTNIPALSKPQSKIVSSIQESESITHLLHGITGSGKTRIYQSLAEHTLKENRSVLILVPEIALTPQLATEFQLLHDRVLILHSALTEAQRHTLWLEINKSDDPLVIVGPRSALFSPIKNLGLIIIDEAHEQSYQQDSQPKYNALRVARKLAELSGNNTKLILGSATPSIADYYVATHTGAPIHNLNHRIVPSQTSVEIIDMREKAQFSTHNLFSKKLLDAMNNALVRNEQIMLFHNRRGTARMILCSDCGWTAECPTCHIPLRLHHDTQSLRCHTCGHKTQPPKVCPSCSGIDLDFKGFGSKRIESEIKKLFPDANVARFDSDTEAAEQLHHRYQDLYDNNIQIIIGTQGIAKGLDLPHLTVVGVVQADSELFIPDYSSSERAFQLTTQVIGRAGRKGQEAHVFIQTLNPEHPAITAAAAQDYHDFYEHEIQERKAEHMPPFTFLLQLSVGYKSTSSAVHAAKKLAQQLRNDNPGLFVRGPAPAFHEHRGSNYYQQLVVSSPNRATLVKIAQSLPSRWHFTLDPPSLL